MVSGKLRRWNPGRRADEGTEQRPLPKQPDLTGFFRTREAPALKKVKSRKISMLFTQKTGAMSFPAAALRQAVLLHGTGLAFAALPWLQHAMPVGAVLCEHQVPGQQGLEPRKAPCSLQRDCALPCRHCIQVVSGIPERMRAGLWPPGCSFYRGGSGHLAGMKRYLLSVAFLPCNPDVHAAVHSVLTPSPFALNGGLCPQIPFRQHNFPKAPDSWNKISSNW